MCQNALLATWHQYVEMRYLPSSTSTILEVHKAAHSLQADTRLKKIWVFGKLTGYVYRCESKVRGS